MPSPQVADGFFGEGVNFTEIAGAFGQLFRVIGHDADLMGDFTVEFVAKWDGAGASDTARFVYANPVNAEYAWYLEIARSGANFVLALKLQPPGQALTTAVTHSLAHSTTYHHLAATYNRTGNAILYWDGVQVATAAAPFSSIVMTSQATSRIELTGAAVVGAEGFKIDNARFSGVVDSAATILDRVMNGLPGD